MKIEGNTQYWQDQQCSETALSPDDRQFGLLGCLKCLAFMQLRFSDAKPPLSILHLQYSEIIHSMPFCLGYCSNVMFSAKVRIYQITQE